MRQLSMADGLPLPYEWDNANTFQKGRIIHHLQGRAGSKAPVWWFAMPVSQRDRVIAHLEEVGSVSKHDKGLRERAEASLRSARSMTERAEQEVMSAWRSRPTVDSYGLYLKPNGGKRMLPSLYGKLREFWVRGNGRTQSIGYMNDGHLENTLKLLKESHGNVTARATDLLGRMALHYQNQPDIVDALEHACSRMLDVEVDDMYPVWKPLAQELESRPKIEDPQIDDDLEPWNDMQRVRHGPYGPY